jgi:hypothetical protein
MSWKKLQESEYESYFDELSKRAKEKLAAIEVMARYRQCFVGMISDFFS